MRVSTSSSVFLLLSFCVLKVIMLGFTWSCFLCVIGIWLVQVRWSKHGTLLLPLWRLVKSVGLHVNQNMPMAQLAAPQRYLPMLHWFLRWEMVTKTVCLKKMCDAISFQNRIVMFSKKIIWSVLGSVDRILVCLLLLCNGSLICSLWVFKNTWMIFSCNFAVVKCRLREKCRLFR